MDGAINGSGTGDGTRPITTISWQSSIYSPFLELGAIDYDAIRIYLASLEREDPISEDDYIIVPSPSLNVSMYAEDDDGLSDGYNSGPNAGSGPASGLPPLYDPTADYLSEDDDEEDQEEEPGGGGGPTQPEPTPRELPMPTGPDRSGRAPDDPGYVGPQPILLDLDGNGIRIAEQSRSGMFVDAGGEGLMHRTAWAGAGDGVLFYDPDGTGAITEKRQYVFTEWDPTATDDLAALRSVFDSNGDGVLNASDAAFASFKVMVSNADGSTTAMTLAQLGITAIDLTADATRIALPDGSVITGQTTFTRSNGSTGTVANATLVAEAQGHRVEQVVSTDGSGNRVVISSAYGADGVLAYAMTSVTSPNGANVAVSYDDNGDGVTDRLQSIVTVTNPDGSTTETLVNRVGADLGTAITVNRTVTTTSADGSMVNIDRDSTGGGWFDQHEARTLAGNGVLSIVLSDLAQNGTVIRSTTSTVSADGFSRSEGVDEDGDGTSDTTAAHVITENPDGSRSEVVTITNADASVRAVETKATSADGRTTTLAHDLDGDGDMDRQDSLAIVVDANGTTTSTISVRNGDASLRNSQTVSQSADALTKTTVSDLDGDGLVDLTTVDATVIAANGDRTTTFTATNRDGSIRGLEMVTLAADKVTSETWIDLDQDGTLEAAELVRSVSIDAGTDARIAQAWSRNPDGSIRAETTTVTSADGLSRATEIDADGDGDIDTSVTDVTTVSGAGVATRLITVSNQDASLRSVTTSTTSADGLTTTTTLDRDGDGNIDARSTDARVLGGDGSTTRTVSSYAGNGTTLLSQSVVVESADRLSRTVTSDADGDGHLDRVVTSVEDASGASVVTETTYHANGVLAARAVSSISANGLELVTETDLNGDAIMDRTVTDVTDLNADGSRTRSVETTNGDGSLRSRTVATVSDDGLATQSQVDANGDGTYERVATSIAVLNANGSVTVTEQQRSADATLLGQSITTTSDDGLVVTALSDADGDGQVDLQRITTTLLHADGGTTTTSELRDAAGVLRSGSSVVASDDGRSVVASQDVNGDGQIDIVSIQVISDDGELTSTRTDYDSSGAVLSRALETMSADGLVRTSTQDRDGNGVFETATQETTVLNADGSVTRTLTRLGADGSIFGETVMETSADGLHSIRSDDLDHDGVADRVTTTSVALAADGTETVTVTSRSADATLLRSELRVTSADRRTVAQSIDADGNGAFDSIATTTRADDGTISTTTSFLSSGGGLEGSFIETVSGDGLSRTYATDRGGVGRFDLITSETTELGVDGSVTQTIVHRNDRNVLLAHEERSVSAGGLNSESRIDLDGDGILEFRGADDTVFAEDGSVIRSQVTQGAMFELLSNVVITTSGNGLVSETVADFTGDGSADRTRLVQRDAGGGSSDLVKEYGDGFNLLRTSLTTVSADGRTTAQATDLDGDGYIDREFVTETDLDRTVTTSLRSIGLNGLTTSQATAIETANGALRSAAIDIDGDGTTDLTRETTLTFGQDGSRFVEFTETYGFGSLAFSEVTTTAADGLSSIRLTDIDGDGDWDGVTTKETVLNADGSRQEVSLTQYADGTLRAAKDVQISADGRSVTTTLDYDGNGIADKIIEAVIGADGGKVETATTYTSGGSQIERFVTSTSADGLVTTILRSGNLQTITRSAVDNGSYVWDNGVAAGVGTTNIRVEHQIDDLGIETWTRTSNWVEIVIEDDGEDTYEYEVAHNSSQEVRLDSAAKQQILAEAARIYDTVLDRDIDFNETEQLLSHISDSHLDTASLVQSLLGSGEFATRYGTMSNAEFVTQIYLNALGRAPSLAELDRHILALAEAGQARSAVALLLAETAEHLAVGNGHMATNNFDVIMNPAMFERSLDAAYVASIVEKIADVVFDRAPTAQELEYLTDRLLRDVDTPEDVAAALLAESIDLPGVSSASLYGLSGDALVEQAFLNAFGRQPTSEEAYSWKHHLAVGNITTAQFVASLALSVEHLSVGNGHLSNPVPATTTLTGTASGDLLTGTAGQDILLGLAGADTLKGGDNSDQLTGGTGNDSLEGGAGYDVYFWSRGDGNDTINDISSLLPGTDKLVLTDVASGDVALSRANGSNNLLVTILNGGVPGEVITVVNRFYNPANNYGIEAIEFSDGVTWSLEDILERTVLNGTASGETLTGSSYRDNLFGLGGNDTLNGGNGDDWLTGGTGNDFLAGAAGDDSYVWSLGDGNDTINDTSTELTTVDRLLLTNVASSGVVLTRVNGTDDLRLTISASGEVITIYNQFNSPSLGYGVETIEFGDGVIWSLRDILEQTVVNGSVASETLTGMSFRDNLYGFAGNDTLNGGDGDDLLVGGTGNDLLVGAGNNDTYVWSLGDGNDTINDTSSWLTTVDRLVLTNVASTGVTLTRANGSDDLRLTITASGEFISIYDQFKSTSSNYGIEEILFADGVTWSLAEIREMTTVYGTAGNDNLTGMALPDNLLGGAGNDTLTGGDGDDRLVGGTGADSLNGGNGNDLYQWATGDGNDTVNDTGTSLIDVDTLELQNVQSTGAVLTKSGNNLQITISATGEVITVTNRFYSSGSGYGVEFITFSDGVVTNVLDSPVAEAIIYGTAANNTLNGWGFRDTLWGYAGADALNGNAGDDRLIGGTGVDTLKGGTGSDSYEWAKGDGNDRLDDIATSMTEVDRLILTDATATEVTLSRVSGSNDLLVTIASGSGTYETITVVNRFSNPASNYGVEEIEFSDGAVWTLSDILERTMVTGSAAAETLSGTSYRDNLFGLTGNDTLNGGDGDDRLEGGAGNDLLAGAGFNDTYVWSLGDGNDTISDTSTSFTTVDRLELTDVASTGVVLTRVNGSDDLRLTITASGEVVTIDNQFNTPSIPYGIEAIDFGDGVTWSLADILAQTAVNGTAANETLTGRDFRDNLYGLAGNDTLNGGLGDDWLTGGLGNDSLAGGDGHDTYVWSLGDGNDTINDISTGLDVVDRLILNGVSSSGISLTRVSGSGLGGGSPDLLLTIIATGEIITIKNQFNNPEYGYGIEVITFDDGTAWTLSDIIENTIVSGTSSAEWLYGTDFQDNIFGLAGNDSIDGDSGNDLLVGGLGADTLNGNWGFDTASYRDSSQRVKLDLGLSGAQTGVAGGEDVGDVLISIEALEGSVWGDTLVGDDASNDLFGLAGNDQLRGNDGYDRIYGGDGYDLIYGGSGSDEIDGGAQYDTIYGGDGNDSVWGGNGRDVIYLEAGDDVFFDNAQSDSNGHDSVDGGVGNDTLNGDGGNDTLLGGDGDDVIVGGIGTDVLTGGGGADQFVFGAALVAGNADQITDFNVIDDTIWLDDAVFTGLAQGWLATTAFVANLDGQATDASHRILYETDTGMLRFDPDGAGGVAAIHFATITPGLEVTSADFFVF